MRWAIDLGRDGYGDKGYFTYNPWTSPNRWQYYRKRAEGNNTLVINPGKDGGQAVDGTASLLNFTSTATLQQGIIDMTNAYATNSGTPDVQQVSATAVTSARRGLRLVGGVAQVQDEIGLSSPQPVDWFMHTLATISLSPDQRTATLTPANGSARLQVSLQSPSNAVFSVMSAKKLDPTIVPDPYENKNAGVTKLCIVLPSTSSTTVTVALCPYTQGGSIPAAPPVTALSAW